MSKEFELKSCPFCGGDAKMEEIGNDATKKRSVTIKCKSCFASRTDAGIRSSMAILRKWAVDAWNKRQDFTAGRALGRREMKGEMRRVVDFLDGQSRRGEIVTANTFRASIEAITEEP